MEELKKLSCDDWINKSPGQDLSIPYAIQCSNRIDEALQNCDDILSEAGYGINYESKRSKMNTLLTDAACLVNYVNSIAQDIIYTIDEPLRENFSKNATETISRIRVEDIETSYNPCGIQGTIEIGGILKSTKPKELKTLKFEDFMSEDRIGGPAREKFANLFKAQYDNGKELHGIDNSMSYDKYIKTLIEDGEFDHVIDTPFESVISNLLDVTIIKPLIEACTGYDMITGDNLSGTQRVFKVGMAAIDIITLGQAIGVQEGLGILTTGVRVIGTNAVANGTVLGVNEVADQLDLPLPIRILLSLGSGYTVAKVAGKYLLYNSEGRVIGEYTGEIKSVNSGSNAERLKYYEKLKAGVIEDTAWNRLNKYAEKEKINLNNISWDEKISMIDRFKADIMSKPKTMKYIELNADELLKQSDNMLSECIKHGYNTEDYYKILNQNKASRNPEEYLKSLENTKLIKNWNEEFYGNDSKVVLSYMPKDSYDNFVLGYGTIGRPGENGGQFVLPEKTGDSIESKLSELGSISNSTPEFKVQLAKELGLPEDVFTNGVVRVEIPLDAGIDLQMVKGIEDGCNYQWIPGGKTLGGTTEGIIRQITRDSDSELYNRIISNVKR